METIPLDEKYPLKPIEVIYFNWRLEDKIDTIYSVNIAKLKDYYNAYGRDQRNNAIKMMFGAFLSMEQEGILLHHARYDLDKVLVASINDSVDEKANEIKNRINLGKIEIIPDLELKDGIDPSKIDVYVGAASGKMQLKDLIDLAIEAEKQAKNSPNRIYIIKG